MILTITERVLLLDDILPARGDVLTMRVVHDLRMALSFSEEELAAAKFSRDGEVLSFDKSGVPDKDIEIGAAAHGVIVEALKKADADKRVTADHLPLFEKFGL